MKKLVGVIVFAALALSGAASGSTGPAGTLFGISDDYGKYSDDSGSWFFGQMNEVGMTVNKMTVNYDPSFPTVIRDQAFLDRSIPQAVARGIKVSLGVGTGKPRSITGDPQGIEKYIAFLRQVVDRYPQVTEYVIGNEPNLSYFWQPQFNADGSGASGAAYEALLAESYDALKALNPDITVVGVGLSPRGNGNPHAVNNISTQPVKFIRDLAAAYRASGRTKPIMDVLGFHPYPAKDVDPISKGYLWPNAGIVNLDRIKQAFWDGFHLTGQPVFPEGSNVFGLTAVGDFVTFKLDEIGWQVNIPDSSQTAYHNAENVKTTDESTQAGIYGQLVRSLPCDRSIRQVLFFGLVDEQNLARWQAGLIRADRTRRASFASVQSAIAETGGQCTGKQLAWNHTESVVGAKALFGGARALASSSGRWNFAVTAEEDASYRAAVLKVSGPNPSAADKKRIRAALASKGTPGFVKGNKKPEVELNQRLLGGGWYVQAVLFRAAMNPERTKLVLGKPFRAG